MGESPDGLVNCSYCGSGVVEIKCPYTCKDIEFHDEKILITGIMRESSVTCIYYEKIISNM